LVYYYCKAQEPSFRSFINILKIAKSFMEHEKSLITEVTALRAKIPSNYQHDNKEAIAQYFKASNEMASKMANLMMQIENYPNLKSDQTMLQAQMTYNEVEENISAARRFYNAAVTELRNVIQIFPGNLIAKLASAELLPFYHADEAQIQVVDASTIL
jgi:LemA protein